ncbi:YrhK family protein [Wenxinia saemankumensis]|uniref:YrhK-like protein n=1 Tax=Wenxinia saemankumensis TaxID=1447782 RepID=A0A1M6ED79_9RHOB|nr:YrhK family protein [Wenxinia saemankumensis]SHI83457.1 YrhK-like protein [Wenxinia saemankumensis]
MQLFRHENRQRSERTKRYYARSELLYTIVDFGAALSFVVGSILFFWEATTIEATWLFLIGSILFAAKPTIRTVREIKLWRMGDMDDLAERDES